MIGDKYQVFYSIAGRTVPHPLGPWDTWREAKAMRDSSFFDFPEVRSCWIMRSNPSLGLRQDIYGHALKRRRRERTA